MPQPVCKKANFWLYITLRAFLCPEVLPDIMRGKVGYTDSTLFIGV